MQRHQVDASAVAVVVEAYLRLDSPAVAAQNLGELMLEPRVPGVGEPVQPLAVPPNRQIDGGVERASRRSIVPTGTPRRLPRSTLDTSSRDTPARLARST
jgi:hypothetical protein